jgi:probable addiction module antidote protein
VRRKSLAAAPSLPYEDWLLESLKDRKEAAAYLEAAIEDGDQAVLMLALRHVAQAQGGVAEIARRANLTREATYKMLSKVGNPGLSSLTAILAATGLRLSVKPVDKHQRKTSATKLAGIKKMRAELQAAQWPKFCIQPK